MTRKTRLNRRNVSTSLLGAIMLLVAAPALSQVDTGTLQGTVKDESGAAVVPNAKVTLTSEGTALSFSTTTRGDGSYIFTPVKIGTYTVEAEAAGFEKARQSHITVNVQQQVVADVTLIPGALTQTVEVTAAPPQLQTQNASLGQVADQRQINDMPLNGRNYTFLAQLAAGVTGINPSRGMDATGKFRGEWITDPSQQLHSGRN